MEIYQLYVNKYEFRNHRILHKFFWVWPRLTFHTALGRSNPDMPYISKYQTLPSRNVIMWNLLEIEVSGIVNCELEAIERDGPGGLEALRGISYSDWYGLWFSLDSIEEITVFIHYELYGIGNWASQQ